MSINSNLLVITLALYDPGKLVVFIEVEKLFV